MKNLSFIFIAVILFSGTLKAEGTKSYTVEYRQTIRSSNSRYKPMNESTNTYSMTSQRTVTDHVVVGEGPLKTHNFKNTGVENTQVLGIDVPGHARIRFERGEDNYSCIVIFKALYGADGESKEIRKVAKFIEGTWSDYVAGQFVRIRIERTDEERQAQRALIEVLTMLQDSISYDNTFSQTKVSAPQIEAVQFEGIETFEGSVESGFLGNSPVITIKGRLNVTFL